MHPPDHRTEHGFFHAQEIFVVRDCDNRQLKFSVRGIWWPDADEHGPLDALGKAVSLFVSFEVSWNELRYQCGRSLLQQATFMTYLQGFFAGCVEDELHKRGIKG